MRSPLARVPAAPTACVVYAVEQPPHEILAGLFHAGFTVVERRFSPNFRQLANELLPDVIIAFVDPRLAEDLAVIRFLAGLGSGSVLVALLATGDDGASVAALEAGADVCLPASAPMALVAAQVTALHRNRAAPAESDMNRRQFALKDLFVDLDGRSISRHGAPIDLTRTQFEILAFLIRSPGRVMTHSEIAAGIGLLPSNASQARGKIKVHMSHMRRKLGAAQDGSNYVMTMRGVGYILQQVESITSPHLPIGDESQAMLA